MHPDGVVRYFDRKEAVGAKILRQLDKGRLASDIYMYHENIVDSQEILLLTHKRVLYAQKNAVMGSWSGEWEYTYEAIQGTPTIEKDGNNRWCIIIHPKVNHR